MMKTFFSCMTAMAMIVASATYGAAPTNDVFGLIPGPAVVDRGPALEHFVSAIDPIPDSASTPTDDCACAICKCDDCRCFDPASDRRDRIAREEIARMKAQGWRFDRTKDVQLVLELTRRVDARLKDKTGDRSTRYLDLVREVTRRTNGFVSTAKTKAPSNSTGVPIRFANRRTTDLLGLEDDARPAPLGPADTMPPNSTIQAYGAPPTIAYSQPYSYGASEGCSGSAGCSGSTNYGRVGLFGRLRDRR